MVELEILSVHVQNQGFYNLFLAFGTIAGLILIKPMKAIGEALLIYTCIFMVGAAMVLHFTLPEMVSGMIIQGGPPSVSLILLIIARKNLSGRK